jgi:outer membrane protein assembly factor BamB
MSNSRRAVAPQLLAIVGLLSTGLVAAAAEPSAPWPQFHGPRRDNISSDTGLRKSWPDGGPRLLWTARGIGHGFATVAIANGLIYTAGNLGDRTVISALDLEGRIRWQSPNGRDWQQPVPGTRSTPTLDGDRLYHQNPWGDVVCLDAATGKQHWTVNILDLFHSKHINWGQAESLLVDGDRLICSPGGPETAMAALDKRTGRLVWKSPSSGDLAGYCSPVLAECQGLRILMTLTSQALIGVDADRGSLLWRFPHETPFEEMITMPVYHDGHVAISTRTTGTVLLKITVEGKKASVAEVWRSENLDNQHGGVILLDGFLYGACHVRNNARWVSLDWATGRQQYAERGIGKGSATYADGCLYCLNERRGVAMVRATPKAHEILSQFVLPEGGEGPTWAHPVVCGGRLYLRHSDYLYAYDVRE